MARAYPASVFVIVPIEDVVATVLDAPVATVNLEHTLGVGLFRRSAGDAVSGFGRALAALLLYGLPFDHEGLSYMRKVEVAVEFGGGPDLSDLYARVVGRRILSEIRFLPVAEVERDIFHESGLVSFGGEVILGLTVDEVVGYRALGEQGIGSDVPTLDVDGVKERNSCFDLVGAFDFFICYAQVTYFFWV